MARYMRQRRLRRRRPRMRPRRSNAAPVPRSYAQIGLDYLKRVGLALAATGGAVAVGGAAAKYGPSLYRRIRTGVPNVASDVADRASLAYEIGEQTAGSVAQRARAAVLGQYERARHAYDEYRAVPDYQGQLQDAARIQDQSWGDKYMFGNLTASQYNQLKDMRALQNRFNSGQISRDYY